MKHFTEIFSNDWVYSFGWTLLHSIWQCCAILLAVLICLRAISGMRSHVRYLVACTGLCLMVITSVATFIYIFGEQSPTQNYEAAFSASAIDGMHAQQPVSPDILSVVTHTLESNMPFIVAIWAVGFLFFTLRLAGGLYCSARIRSNAVATSRDWELLIDRARHKLGIARRVFIRQSANITSPIVLGYLKPMIVVPLGMLSGLTTDQCETILFHELAHIRRHDYLTNLVQTSFETIFFFNPFVHILSKEIRKEREYCCDDLVVLHRGSHAYAAALVRVAEARLSPSGFGLALADDKNQLLDRIKRIMERSLQNSAVKSRVIVPALLLSGGLLCISWLGSHGSTVVDNLPVGSYDTVPDKKTNSARYSRKSIITLDENGQPHEEIIEEFEGDESLRPLMKESIPAPPPLKALRPDLPMRLQPGVPLPPDTIPPRPFAFPDHEWEAFSKSFEDHLRSTFEHLHDRLEGDSAFFHRFEDEFNFPGLESFRLPDEALKALENLEHSDALQKLDDRLRHMRDFELERLRDLQQRLDMKSNDTRSYEEVLRRELEKDGYLSSDESIESLEWNKDSFKVNGKEVKESDRKKYKEINDGFFGHKGPGNTAE